MPRGIPEEKTRLRECVSMLRKTLKEKDWNWMPLELDEYWAANEDTFRQLCIEARESVYQEFMRARRSIREFSKWWPGDDVSVAMLDGKLLMMKVEKGREREWQEKFELIDIKEIREMLARKKHQAKKQPEIEYVEIYQDEMDRNTERITKQNIEAGKKYIG